MKKAEFSEGKHTSFEKCDDFVASSLQLFVPLSESLKLLQKKAKMLAVVYTLIC